MSQMCKLVRTAFWKLSKHSSENEKKCIVIIHHILMNELLASVECLKVAKGSRCNPLSLDTPSVIELQGWVTVHLFLVWGTLQSSGTVVPMSVVSVVLYIYIYILYCCDRLDSQLLFKTQSPPKQHKFQVFFENNIPFLSTPLRFIDRRIRQRGQVPLSLLYAEWNSIDSSLWHNAFCLVIWIKFIGVIWPTERSALTHHRHHSPRRDEIFLLFLIAEISFLFIRGFTVQCECWCIKT